MFNLPNRIHTTPENIIADLSNQRLAVGLERELIVIATEQQLQDIYAANVNWCSRTTSQEDAYVMMIAGVRAYEVSDTPSPAILF